MKCIITGSNGYIGSILKTGLSDAGYNVVEFARNPKANQVRYSLEEVPSTEELHAELLVHCAYDMQVVSWDSIQRININGSINLLRQASNAGTKKIIFISSISAFEGCNSLYGKAKLEIEKVAREVGAIIVRPGLVHGNSSGGMVGTLTKLVKSLKIIPLVGGSKLMYLCNQEDLCKLIVKLGSEDPKEWCDPIIAAYPSPLTFREILSRLAKRSDRKVRFLPLPWQLAWIGLKSLEIIGLKPPFKSDSLVSLMNPDPNPNFASLQKLGVDFKSI